jgi:hypothetical protein
MASSSGTAVNAKATTLRAAAAKLGSRVTAA